MILLPKLTPDELNIFCGKQVIICGITEQAKELYHIYHDNQIQVVAFWSDSSVDQRKHQYQGIRIITTQQLERLAKERNDLLVQSLSFDKRVLDDLKDKLEKMNIEISNIPIGKLKMAFSPSIILQLAKNNNIDPKWKDHIGKKKKLAIRNFIRNRSRNAIFLCLPTKTADYTLEHTFDMANETSFDLGIDNKLFHKLSSWNTGVFKDSRSTMYKMVRSLIAPLDRVGKNIEYMNLRHRPSFLGIKKQKYQKQTFKIITAVREPISQNLSMMYQDFSTGSSYKDWIFGEVDYNAQIQHSKISILQRLETLFLEHGDDAQLMFEAFIDRYVYSDIRSDYCRSIQQFIPEFSKYLVDILAYPFDKEKGYALIKEGNIEVFVYQLEKLNQLVTELSDFVGVPFDTLVRGNDASDKWIASSYKQAQKEIQITEEYFEKCFDEPYVKHCYSKVDIEKFKERWRLHIK